MNDSSLKENIVDHLNNFKDNIERQTNTINTMLDAIGNPSTIHIFKRSEKKRLEEELKLLAKDASQVTNALEAIEQNNNFQPVIDILDMQIQRGQEIISQYDNQMFWDLLNPFGDLVLAGGGGLFGPRAQYSTLVGTLKNLKDQTLQASY